MNRDLLIHEIKEALISADINSSLVNFHDDEVYWDKIASIVVDTIACEVEILHHDDKTIDKIRTVLSNYLKTGQADFVINDLMNEGILFRERVPGEVKVDGD